MGRWGGGGDDDDDNVEEEEEKKKEKKVLSAQCTLTEHALLAPRHGSETNVTLMKQQHMWNHQSADLQGVDQAANQIR